MLKKAGMSGDRWKDKDNFVMFFIYTPVLPLAWQEEK